ncbi:MAG: hypothetical protein ABI883_05345 [Chthoniobacterales bacterium]
MKNKSTYSLLINANAEEKGRSIFETAVYSIVSLCMIASCIAFLVGSIHLPGRVAQKAPTPEKLLIQTVAEQPAFASTN